jgi:hypothetical protein
MIKWKLRSLDPPAHSRKVSVIERSQHDRDLYR